MKLFWWILGIGAGLAVVGALFQGERQRRGIDPERLSGRIMEQLEDLEQTLNEG